MKKGSRDTRRINVAVVGTGMYVCGRGTEGNGTIIPALIEFAGECGLGEVRLVGRSASGVRAAKKRIEELGRKMRMSIPVKYYYLNKDGSKNYLKAFKDIEKPACAIIAVPDNLHHEVAVAAIKNGLHALVVKPLVPTLKEAVGLVKLQSEKGVYCAVEFHKRFDEANLKLRDAVRSGAIGDPLYFVVEFSQRRDIPEKAFRKWVKKTNIFQYLGIHYVDMIHFVTGATPRRAMAIGQKNWLQSKGINAFDSVEAVIEWEAAPGKRFISAIVTNWVDPKSTSAMSDQKIKVIGTKGRFESDQKDRGITMVTDETGILQPNPYFCSSYTVEGRLSYRGYGIESIRTFLRDISDIEREKIKMSDLENRRPTFKDSLVPTAVLEAVNESLRKNGEWVVVKKVKRI